MSERTNDKTWKNITQDAIKVIEIAHKILEESPYIKVRKGDARVERMCIFSIANLLINIRRDY